MPYIKDVTVMRLASRFGRYNSIRRERPLTDDELMQFVPRYFPVINMSPGVNVIRIFQQSISSISYVMRFPAILCLSESGS